MAISLFAKSRTVLLVTDEVLYIYATSPRGTRLVESVPWGAENFEENVASILRKECSRRPVLVLNDMVEQHYRKERVIRTGVGVLDRAALLKRKLRMAFPNCSVRAALHLKEKVPKTKTQPAADVYIFAAVPDSPQFEKTISAVKGSLLSFSGFFLLPVESSDMMKALSGKRERGRGKKAAWSVFIGQHKNGSLRQIVTKNGELALTRMSPVIDSDSDPVLWAKDVHREFKATMSYLSRFGYNPDDGLSVTVIANDSAGEALEDMVGEEEGCDFTTMTVSEAARALGLSIGPQEDQRYADVLHVAWAARKKKFILPMKAATVDEVSRARQAAMAASIVLLGGAIFLGYQISGKMAGLVSVNEDIRQLSQKKAHLDAVYEQEVQRKESLGFDVRLVQGSIAVYAYLKARDIDSLALFKGIGYALGKDLRIDKIELERSAPPSRVTGVIAAVTRLKKPAPFYTARLYMTYPGTTDVEKGNKEVGDLKLRLEKALPSHSVKVAKYLKDYEYTEGIIVETGDLETQGVDQDFVAEILIEGPKVDD